MKYARQVRVFVCHATEDKPRVRQLCKDLRDDGFEPWLDEEQLLPGHDWELEINAAVRQSDAILVCLSNRSVEKVGFVQKEIKRILDYAEYQPEGRIFVIPLRLEPCPVPASLSKLHHADLFSEKGFENLRRSLRAGNAKKPANGPVESADEPRAKDARINIRRVAMAAGLVGVVVIGAVLASLLPRNSPPKISKGSNLEAVPAGMIAIPGGRFLMGRNDAADPEASPAHPVEVKPFYIDRLPVTNSDYREFLRSSNRISAERAGEQAGSDDWPATRVTWDEATAYCLARGKRLPSEAEWEFAARGTDGRLYPWGDAFSANAANSLEAAIGHPEPVAKRPGNSSPFQIADMSGNVWEWCADDYRPYAGRPASFAIPASAKVIRGGSFQSDRFHVTAVTRNLERASTASPAIGFRCAK